VLEGLEGRSGLSRGEAMSESESGDASGLLVSESSSMAGYGGEEGGKGGRRGCRAVGRREVYGEMFVCQAERRGGGQSGHWRGGGSTVVGDRDGQAASSPLVDRAVAQTVM
jgi:hypothetical protein